MSNHRIVNNAEHLDLRVHTEPDRDRGDGVMATLVVPDEFRRVQSEFPIVFRRNQADGRFTALALFGFENSENLFLDGSVWDARYRPLSLAVQPLLIGRAEDGVGAGQVHIDLDHPRIARDDNGTRLFEEDGRPSPYLDDMAGKLGELHVGLDAMAELLAALERHDLLEPFALEVPLADGSKHSLVGFHIIDEAKLRALDADALNDLHRVGYLLPIFMAVASLSQFSGLIDRKNAKLADG